VERFIVGREEAITTQNILARWRGAGLFPENMHRILIQLSDYQDPTSVLNTPPLNNTTPSSFFPNSCRPDPSSVHAVNEAFLAQLEDINISTLYKTQVCRLCNFMKEYQAEALILKTELEQVKEINEQRKERANRKRHILKNVRVASTEEIEKALREVETETKKKKKVVKGKGKRIKKPVELSENETDSGTSDSLDIQGPRFSRMLDCIEVTARKS